MKVAGTEQAVEFGEAEMVGQAVVVHHNPLRLQSPIEVFFQNGPFPGSCFHEEFLNPSFLRFRYVNPVGMHPAAKSGEGL